MKMESKSNSKKAVSLLVSYVLLILLTVSIAGMIYGFLQYRARLPEKISCPDDVNVYVINFSCDAQNKKIKFWIKNKGLWNISGINVKVYSGIRVCSQDEFGMPEGTRDFPLPPQNETKLSIGYGNCQPDKLDKLEILPFIIEKPKGLGPAIKERKIYCSNSIIKVDVSC